MTSRFRDQVMLSPKPLQSTPGKSRRATPDEFRECRSKAIA